LAPSCWSAASPCGRVCAGRYRGCCTPSCPAFSHCRHRPLQRGFRQRAIAATPQDAEGDPQALIRGQEIECGDGWRCRPEWHDPALGSRSGNHRKWLALLVDPIAPLFSMIIPRNASRASPCNGLRWS
jgi:hypothetical protein